MTAAVPDGARPDVNPVTVLALTLSKHDMRRSGIAP